MLIHYIRQTSHDCLVASYGITYFDIHLGIYREVEVDTRTQFDESHVVVTLCCPPYLGVSDNTSCHGSGHLAYRYLCAGRRLYDDE